MYVLAKVDANALGNAVAELAKITGIKAADAVTGPYDMLICIEGENVARILSTVLRDVRQIPGILSTETLVVINLE